MKRMVYAILIILALFCPTAPTFAQEHEIRGKTVESVYPGLTSAALNFATLEDLPAPVILRAGELEITSQKLNAEIARAPQEMRIQLRDNQTFLLEQLATKELLLLAARKDGKSNPEYTSGKAEEKIIREYLKALVAVIEVTDQEITSFYTDNKDMFGGASFNQVKDQLKNYVLQQKQQEAITEHIRNLGKMMPIVVSASWLREQAPPAMDNPVDKARNNGKPSLVDFGASGCRPCDMMTPILAHLKSKYEGRLNVLFVHVREEQILAARYGIQSIPVQVFFDSDGKELYRHTGFFPQYQIERKLLELGMR